MILNTMEVVTDLLERKAVIYSDRPSFVMVGELMGLNQVSISPPLCQVA